MKIAFGTFFSLPLPVYLKHDPICTINKNYGNPFHKRRGKRGKGEDGKMGRGWGPQYEIRIEYA
jgi:hypothetical protein